MHNRKNWHRFYEVLKNSPQHRFIWKPLFTYLSVCTPAKCTRWCQPAKSFETSEFNESLSKHRTSQDCVSFKDHLKRVYLCAFCSQLHVLYGGHILQYYCLPLLNYFTNGSAAVIKFARLHYLPNCRHLPPWWCECQHTVKRKQIEYEDVQSQLHNWQLQLNVYLHWKNSLLDVLWRSRKLSKVQSVFWHCTLSTSRSAKEQREIIYGSSVDEQVSYVSPVLALSWGFLILNIDQDSHISCNLKLLH